MKMLGGGGKREEIDGKVLSQNSHSLGGKSTLD